MFKKISYLISSQTSKFCDSHFLAPFLSDSTDFIYFVLVCFICLFVLFLFICLFVCFSHTSVGQWHAEGEGENSNLLKIWISEGSNATRHLVC